MTSVSTADRYGQERHESEMADDVIVEVVREVCALAFLVTAMICVTILIKSKRG